VNTNLLLTLSLPNMQSFLPLLLSSLLALSHARTCHDTGAAYQEECCPGHDDDISAPLAFLYTKYISNNGGAQTAIDVTWSTHSIGREDSIDLTLSAYNEVHHYYSNGKVEYGYFRLAKQSGYVRAHRLTPSLRAYLSGKEIGYFAGYADNDAVGQYLHSQGHLTTLEEPILLEYNMTDMPLWNANYGLQMTNPDGENYLSPLMTMEWNDVGVLLDMNEEGMVTEWYEVAYSVHTKYTGQEGGSGYYEPDNGYLINKRDGTFRA
jgi:hypothetical protein